MNKDFPTTFKNLAHIQKAIFRESMNCFALYKLSMALTILVLPKIKGRKKQSLKNAMLRKVKSLVLCCLPWRAVCIYSTWWFQGKTSLALTYHCS